MSAAPHRVVIAGGGIAGLETALALRALAADRVQVDLVADEATFTYRPLAVLEPFRAGAVRRFAVDAILANTGVRRHRGRVVAVDTWARRAGTEEGLDLDYDALVVALGAETQPAVPGAVTFRDHRSVAGVEQILTELAADAVRTVAYVVPAGVAWALPAYELALLTAAWCAEHAPAARVGLVTAEAQPLEAFGPEVSADVRALLADRGVRLATERVVESVEDGRAWMGVGGSFAVERAVALPALRGRRLVGLPADGHGFLPVEEHGRVRGADGVWAAGDVTDHPVKQGGLAARQADAAAADIARRAGAEVNAAPVPSVLRGLLLTGEAPRYLRAGLTGAEVQAEPPWWPPAKVVARHLAPALAALADAKAGGGTA